MALPLGEEDSHSYDWPKGVDLFHLKSIDSTNAEAFRRMRQGQEIPFWVVSKEQTGGRGRRGRAWVSPVGNLYASYCQVLTDSLERIAQRSFVAALALRETLENALSKHKVDLGEAVLSLKWPNDVLLNQGKIAGILLETQKAADQRSMLAIGMGVNLLSSPSLEQVESGARVPVSFFLETGVELRSDDFLNDLALSFARWEGFLISEGFSFIRTKWLSYATKLGEPIIARFGAQSYEGIFETIDENGHLILQIPGEKLTIPSAEVFF